MTTTLPQNPFPGMNPYLERSDIWPGVHLLVIAELQGFLAPRLQPDYVVTVGERVYVIAEPSLNGNGTDGENVRIPDVAVLAGAAEASPENPDCQFERSPAAVAVQLPAMDVVRERYLEVRRVDHHQQVIAVIELLSPTNKSGDGRKEYLSKRAEVLYSPTHLVEIDLLRAGSPCLWLATYRTATTAFWLPTPDATKPSRIYTRSVSVNPFRYAPRLTLAGFWQTSIQPEGTTC